MRRNRVRDGIVYLQITRGVARRDHAFPPPGTRPSVVVTARNLDFAGNERAAAEGVAVITVPDNRWERVDIKSISLLPNVLAKQAAREQGAKEAWFVDRHGHVTEGSSSNAWIVTKGGKVVTRPADNGILRGITRTVLLDVIGAQGLNWRSARSRSRRPRRRARPSSPRPARSSCRWCGSTAGRSATARRDRWRLRCGRSSTATPNELKPGYFAPPGRAGLPPTCACAARGRAL